MSHFAKDSNTNMHSVNTCLTEKMTTIIAFWRICVINKITMG